MAVRAAAGNGNLTKAPNGFSSGPWTAIGWQRAQLSGGVGHNAISLVNAGVTTYNYLYVGTDGAVTAGTDGGFGATSTGEIPTDTWVPVVLTRTGSTVTARRVNSLASATYGSAGTNTVASIWALGSQPGESRRDIRGLKIWSALLSADEIAAEIQQFEPVRTTGLVHYAPLSVHTDLTDAIAGGSWTNNGATLSTTDDPANVAEEWAGPKVASSATTAATSSSGGLSCNLPGGIAVGDLLLAFAVNDTSVAWTTSGATWVVLANGQNGTAVQGAVLARIATGSDSLTITGEANDIAVVTARIPAALHGVTNVATDIVVGTVANGASAAPNPGNCNPGTSKPWLWLPFFVADDDDDVAQWWPAEAAPLVQLKSAASTSSCMVGVAYHWLEASSYDAGAFALSASEEWLAGTIAIPPAASGSTGTLAATESGSDTAALAGDVLVEGSLAATESGSDVAALSGDVYVSGTLAATESGSDVAAIEGVTVNVATGSLAATESGSDTAEIVGVVLAQGTLAANDSGEDTAAITGVVLVSGTLDATEAGSDTAVIAAVALVQGSLDATETGSDTAAFASSTPVTTAYPGPAGRATKGKRRRVIIGERLYNVLERDIPALLEAELLDRAPPVTAEVIEGPKPPRKRAKKAPQPVKTVEQVRETVQQIKRRIEPDDAWLAQALEAVAFRVLERLQDEEDSLMLLLAA